MTSPTQRSLRYLRDEEGWPYVSVVEYWNQYAKRRIDLFGFADVVALRPAPDGCETCNGRSKMLLVQVTTGSHGSTHIQKMRDDEHAAMTLDIILDMQDVSVELHAWRKVRVCGRCGLEKRGGCKCKGTRGRQMWRPRITIITKELLHGK